MEACCSIYYLNSRRHKCDLLFCLNDYINSHTITDSFAPTKLIVEHHNTSAVELTWFGGEGQIEADIVWCTASFLCQVYKKIPVM